MALEYCLVSCCKDQEKKNKQKKQTKKTKSEQNKKKKKNHNGDSLNISSLLNDLGLRLLPIDYKTIDYPTTVDISDIY